MKIKSLKFKSVNSTNDIALDLIKRNKFKPTLISADQQIKGRGTMGKKWVSKKGNLYLTIYFEINQKKINFKHYAVLNAYLLKYIIKKNYSDQVQIKWPNDLLIKKKKICGILQEVLKNGKPNALRINALHILLLKASLFIIVYLRYKICKKLLLHIVRQDPQLIWFVNLKRTILIYNLY